MIEFDSVCYFQNHKTGCTFVESFLREFCCEPVRRYHKHAPFIHRAPGKYHFVNVREPLDAYLSLFNYGLDGRGAVFERLQMQGLSHHYAQGMDGFEEWLTFVLDPRHAVDVYPPAGLPMAHVVGLQSMRFLRLASPGLEASARLLGTRAAINQYFKRSGTVDSVVRYESLVDDVSELVRGPLSGAMTSNAQALQWLRQTPRINASNRRDGRVMPTLSPALRTQLQDREWYLYENFYQ